MPDELIRYKYREIFHLSAEDMDNEPADELFTNWLIYGYIKERELMESKKNNDSTSKH